MCKRVPGQDVELLKTWAQKANGRAGLKILSDVALGETQLELLQLCHDTGHSNMLLICIIAMKNKHVRHCGAIIAIKLPPSLSYPPLSNPP